MPFYQIREINDCETKDPYYVYKGKEEVEVQLNQGFAIAKNLLEFIHHSSRNGHSMNLGILYQHEKLTYFLQSTDAQLIPILSNQISSCSWEKVEREMDTSFAKEKEILRGCASPLVIRDREENLIDELVRMMPKESFFIQVKWEVKDIVETEEHLRWLAKHINELAQKAAQQVGEQGHLGENLSKMIFGGENISYQLKDISAQQQMEILENHLFNLKTQGNVFCNPEFHIYGDYGTANIIAARMESFSKRSGSLGLHQLRRDQPYSMDYLNYAPTNFIASLIALPMTRVPGIQKNKHVEFGADVQEKPANSITLGYLVTHYETNLPIHISIKDLTQHVFVGGVTGSGKTSTIKHLLTRIYQEQKPFLIIEPAKTEYQYLHEAIPLIRRYTLGIEGSLSFKINPFEFPEHIHIQTHLDHLKSVFVAAFPMYGPMPYILETAFYQIYRRTGWDFISGRNIYEGKLDRKELFPTLHDLYQAIDQAIEGVGYSADLANDVRGALKVRIGSLLSGAKGAMLNTRQGKNIRELLQTPTVLELEYIGDDQEKVFLMGLLLISMYEHYISAGIHSGSLEHLLVIEEAHRLLENTKSTGNQEMADMKGKAVETFNHILSEIRTYGQGIVIADQIPTKLSPDVIKNTNLKILHRLFAKDDRQLVGDSIGLEEEQVKEMIRLQQGEAVIYHGRLREPLKIKVKVDREILAENQSDSPKWEKAPFDYVDYLVRQDSFRKTSDRLIQTYLLFPQQKEKVYHLLEESVKYLLASQDLIPSMFLFLQKIVEQYMKENRLLERLSFLEEIHILRELKKTDDPLGYLLFFLSENTVKNQEKHKLGHFSTVYTQYSKWKAWMTGEEKIILSMYQEFKHDFHYRNPMVTDLILKRTKVSKELELSLLNQEQKRQLCYAIVLYELSSYMTLLEKYFQIQSIQPVGGYSI